MVWTLQSVSTLSSNSNSHQTHPSTDDAHSLAPKYEELGTLYANTAVTIAKVDATANDVPDEVQGFPTIKLFPAGAKDTPIEYQGDRTVEDLAKFIEENGKFKVAAKLSAAGTSEEIVMGDAEDMGHAAPAATKVAEKAEGAVKGAAEKVGSVVEAVKGAATAAVGDGEIDLEGHDEL